MWQLPSDSLPSAVIVHVAARMHAMVVRDGLRLEEAAERLASELAPKRGGDTAAELQLFGGIPVSAEAQGKSFVQVNSAELPLEQFDDASEDRYAPWEWAQGIPGALLTCVVDANVDDLSDGAKDAVKSAVNELAESEKVRDAMAQQVGGKASQSPRGGGDSSSAQEQGSNSTHAKILVEAPPLAVARALAECARDAIGEHSPKAEQADGSPAHGGVVEGPLAYVPEWRAGQWVWVPCCVLMYSAPEQPQHAGADATALMGFGGRFLVQKVVVPGAASKDAAETAWKRQHALLLPSKGDRMGIGERKWVRRLNLRFAQESLDMFLSRRGAAEMRREKVKSMIRLRRYIQSLPSDEAVVTNLPAFWERLIAIRAGEGVRDARMRKQRREKHGVSRFGDPNATGSAAAAAARRVLAAASRARAGVLITRPSTRGQSRVGNRGTDGKAEDGKDAAASVALDIQRALQKDSTSSLEAFANHVSAGGADGRSSAGASSMGALSRPEEVDPELERAKAVVGRNLDEIRRDFREALHLATLRYSARDTIAAHALLQQRLPLPLPQSAPRSYGLVEVSETGARVPFHAALASVAESLELTFAPAWPATLWLATTFELQFRNRRFVDVDLPASQIAEQQAALAEALAGGGQYAER